MDGKKHYLVNEGEGGVFDGARAAKDLEAIVREYRRMWGFLPYEKYLFLNLLTESGGGLEHKNSTVLMASRWTTRTRRSYNNWLDLASHEFFHAWNVKRLRPVELGPFDYENEVHTKNLWIAEGVTEYYADLTLHRAGLITRDEYLDSVSDRIEELQTTPGRLVQSAEMASYDAWIKYYRPDENSINTAVSYYTKGSVVGLLLDARIRKATNGAKSLDDVMKAAYEKYSGMRGYTADEFRAVAEQVAGISLKTFWDSAVSGTDELDYKEALDTLGLRFRSVSVPADRPGRAWLGIGTRNDAGRLVVTQVRRDTPGAGGGAERGRRDPGDRRLPRARGSPRQPPRAVPPRRQGGAPRRAPRAAAAARAHVRHRTHSRLAARGEPLGHRGAAEQPRALAQPGSRVSVSTTGDQAGMTSRYVGVVVVWVAVLLALYAVQQYFS